MAIRASGGRRRGVRALAHVPRGRAGADDRCRGQRGGGRKRRWITRPISIMIDPSLMAIGPLRKPKG